MVKNTVNIKATIKHLIVAFIYVFIVILIINIFFVEKISWAISLINTISVGNNQRVSNGDATTVAVENIKLNSEKRMLESYPKYGTQYATIEIPAIDVNLPLYYGDTLSILKLGIGQSSGSYFPGEGGAILCSGHSYKGYIRSLPQAKIGDVIKIHTGYGDFEYTIYDTKVIHETDVHEVPIQHEEEIFMLYTCYPVDQLGHPTKRFVVYAK